MDLKVVRRILEGDVGAASRLMRDIEDQVSGSSQALKQLYAYTGRAYIIGITGSPGVGKSTIVDKMVDHFRKEGKTVGVVAIDPSSPFTGGAILGDRIRMQNHATDPQVFVRSVATRGCLGGLSRSANDIVNVMDAMGKEIIVVETVGVGQAEVDIVNTAHTSIVVQVPGMGDEIQALKAGIIEIGEIFVINKCEREGTDKSEAELRLALQMSRRNEDGWQPPIIRTEAASGRGIAELVAGIYDHKRALERSGGLERKIAERTKAMLLEILQNEVIAYLTAGLEKDSELTAIVENLMKKRTDPYSVVEQIMARELVGRRPH